MPFLLERKKLKKVEKFVTNLQDKKDYVVQTRNVKQTLNHGNFEKKFME